MIQHLIRLRLLLLFFLIISTCFSSSCSSVASSAFSGMMENLSYTILNNNDLEMVETGAPAYLLMVDSIVKEDNENEDMLIAASVLYNAYADTFVSDKERARKMADKAFGYANRAMCLRDEDFCLLKNAEHEKFKTIVNGMEEDDIHTLFTLGSSWASWIRANSNDFNAIADISRIEIIMEKVIELDESYKDGAAFLYLGISATLLPPALGGKPEKGRQCFEKAMELSQGKNLMIKVIFAKQYARMLFDRDLHDRLLREVLEEDPDIEGYTLINTYAQKQAIKLLESADEYF